MQRNRQSMLTPYHDLIVELLAAGCTFKEIAEQLNLEVDEEDKFKPENIYSYAKNHELKSLITQGSKNGRIDIPKCSECEDCVMVTNTFNSQVMMCHPKLHMISKSCAYSPIWCPKRSADRTQLAEKYGIF